MESILEIIKKSIRGNIINFYKKIKFMLTQKEKIELILQRGYYTKDGKLYNKDNKEIKGIKGTHGYHEIRVSYNNRPLIIRTHRFVAFIKYGDVIFNKGIVVRHLDDNKLNFHESNIVIGYQKDNITDIPKSKRTCNKGKRPLSPEDIEFIRINKDNYTNKQLGDMFNRTHISISRIRCGRGYNSKKLKKEDIINIRNSKLSHRELSKIYNRSIDSIRDIKYKRFYRYIE